MMTTGTRIFASCVLATALLIQMSAALPCGRGRRGPSEISGRSADDLEVFEARDAPADPEAFATRDLAELAEFDDFVARFIEEEDMLMERGVDSMGEFLDELD